MPLLLHHGTVFRRRAQIQKGGVESLLQAVMRVSFSLKKGGGGGNGSPGKASLCKMEELLADS